MAAEVDGHSLGAIPESRPAVSTCPVVEQQPPRVPPSRAHLLVEGVGAGEEQVDEPVVVEIPHGGAPCELVGARTGVSRHVGVGAVPVVEEQGVRPEAAEELPGPPVVGEEQVDVAVVVDVAGGPPHPGPDVGQPGLGMHVGEGVVAVVAPQGDRLRAAEAGGEQVGPAVAVEVAEQPEDVAVRLVDSRKGADVGEGAVAVVEEQAAPLGGDLAAAYVEVEQAVPVDVSPGGPDHGAQSGDAGSRGDVGEGPVPPVVVEPGRGGAAGTAAAGPGDEEVLKAVVVDVPRHRGAAAAAVGDPGPGGDVGEGAVPEVAEQGVALRGAARDEQVEEAVAVEIEPGRPVPADVAGALLRVMAPQAG